MQRLCDLLRITTSFSRAPPGAETRGLRSESDTLRAAAFAAATGGALRLVQLVVQTQRLGGLAHGGIVLGRFLVIHGKMALRNMMTPISQQHSLANPWH